MYYITLNSDTEVKRKSSYNNTMSRLGLLPLGSKDLSMSVHPYVKAYGIQCVEAAIRSIYYYSTEHDNPSTLKIIKGLVDGLKALNVNTKNTPTIGNIADNAYNAASELLRRYSVGRERDNMHRGILFSLAKLVALLTLREEGSNVCVSAKYNNMCILSINNYVIAENTCKLGILERYSCASLLADINTFIERSV